MYPVIEKYMIDHNLTIRKLAKQCDASYPCMQNVLCGKSSPRKWLIDNLIKLIGEPYEVVFREEQEQGTEVRHSVKCKY